MLFFADHSHLIDLSNTAQQVSSTLASIAEHYRRNEMSPYRVALDTHAELVAAVIVMGEAHQALADQLCPTSDDVVAEVDQMASTGLLLGRCLSRSVDLLRHGSDKDIRNLPELFDRASSAVARIAKLGSAGPLLANVTEGYAFYSLYPEMYLSSLSRALDSNTKSRSYVVVGIRSIGTSLATIVAGALIEKGYTARVETLRPRGNPFDRYVDLAPKLKARLMEASHASSGFIIVDEGPGLTCSSFLSVSSALEKMGIDQERITLLSAWQGKPSIYASEELRERWKRSRVFYTPAEEAFDGWQAFVPYILHSVKRSSDENGHTRIPDVEIADLSYGRWRERFYPSPDQRPVVHQTMERTKILFTLPAKPSSSTVCGNGHNLQEPIVFAKFAGLGSYGREKLDRARILAGAGFGPPVIELAYGFLLHPFLEDFRPMSARELTLDSMARMVDYYAFIFRKYSKPPMDRFDSLMTILEVNAGEGLKLDLSEFDRRWRPFREAVDQLPLVLLDGKPQPYEWLTGTVRGQPTSSKADSADHFRDHTLVGEQSILWDLAGTCVEWEMDDCQVSQFLSLWERETGDHQAASLLDFFRAAYLAFRVAAVHYATQGTSEEGTRTSLQRQQAKYVQRLHRLIAGCRELVSDG